MPTTAAGILVDRLIAWGVDTVFGIPGDGNNGLVEALRERCAVGVARHAARARPDLPPEEVLVRSRAAVHAIDAQVHRMPVDDRDEQVRRLSEVAAAVLGLPDPCS